MILLIQLIVLIECTLGIYNLNFRSITVGTMNKCGCYREDNGLGYVILILIQFYIDIESISDSGVSDIIFLIIL